MLKYYLHRSGQIPVLVHPFVKQEALRQPKHPSVSNRWLPLIVVQRIVLHLMSVWFLLRQMLLKLMTGLWGMPLSFWRSNPTQAR